MFALVFIVPTLCYTVAMFDRQYFGIFHESEPVLAKTTANKKYYSANNIPFKTSDDVNRDHEMVRYNRSLGLPAHYELEHKQFYTFSNGIKKIQDHARRFLKTKEELEAEKKANEKKANEKIGPKSKVDAELEAAKKKLANKK